MTIQTTKDWLSLVCHGQLVTRQWLLQQGATPHALDNALKSGKLLALSRGVFTRPGVPVEWQGLAGSLNRMSAQLVYVGGLTALAQQGLAHYVSFSPAIDMYSALPAPGWLNKLAIKTHWHSTARLWDMQVLLAANSLKTMPLHQGYWLLASPEQALLEVLALLPERISFEQVDKLMQAMVNLSPRRLDVLLSACQHVQVKRLFFFFSDRYSHTWRQKIHSADYDLGAGKRSVVAGGRLDKTYNITVPDAFYGSP